MAGRPATLKVDIIADAKRVGTGVAEAESKLSRIGKAGKFVGAAAAAGLAVAGAAAVKLGVDSVKAASEVQQSYGALDTVFGKSADRVKRWAAGAADSVGLAKSEYAGLASLVGSQLQGMGFATDKSANKTKALVKMGADLAATYGGSVSDAVSAVSSLLKGETDPIERYGVSIKAADVSARLAAQGLDGLTGKAGKQAKAQATLSLLTQQTTKAQGAFKRESSTLAGQQERLRAKVENLKASIGQKLLPVVTRIVSWLSQKFLPAAVKLGKHLARELGPTFRQVGGWITGTLVPAVQRIYTWFRDKLAPALSRNLQPVLRGVRAAFGDVKDAVDRNRPTIDKLVRGFAAFVEFYVRRVHPIVGKALGLAFRAAGKIIGGTIDHISRMTEAFGWAIEKVQSLIGWLGKIKVPDVGGAISKLSSMVGGSVGGMTLLQPRVAGEAPSYGPGAGLSTASLLSASTSWSTFASSPAPAGQVLIVDKRDLSTSVQLPADPLGLVDEARTARRLQQLLDKHAVRIGAASTLRLA